MLPPHRAAVAKLAPFPIPDSPLPIPHSFGEEDREAWKTGRQKTRLRRLRCHFYDVLAVGFRFFGSWALGFLGRAVRLFGLRSGCSRSTVPSMQSYKIKTYFKSFSGTFWTALRRSFVPRLLFPSFLFPPFFWGPGSFNIHIWDALLMICCNFFDFLLVLYIFLNETF